MYHYPLAIELGDAQHAFGVEVPDIPGCFSAGDTLDDAINQAHEAINLHLAGLAEDGELPPQPKQVSTYATSSCYKGRVWALASIDETPFLGKSEKFNVTLPKLLARQIDEFTSIHKEFKNRSYFLQQAARKLLEHTD
jgi:predicted RNase H-like HicB family nuclease